MMKLYNWTELTEAQKESPLKRPSLSRNESQKQLVKKYLDSIKQMGIRQLKRWPKNLMELNLIVSGISPGDCSVHRTC